MFKPPIWPAFALSLCLFSLPAIAAAPEPGDQDGDQTDAPAPEPEAMDADPVEPEPAEPEPEPVEPEPTPEPTPEPETVEAPTEQKPPIEPEPQGPSAAMGDKHSLVYTNLLAPRINPLGLEERLWIGYQYRLYDKDKTILNGSNLGIFFRPIVSPAIALVGATVQVQPAAVLRLRATYSWLAYYGNFQYMQSFQSPHDDFSETRLGAMADAGQNYSTTGQQIELEALLQARYKGLVLRSALVANYNVMKLRGDDDLFYDVRIDALVANRAWVLLNDTDLLWLQDLKTPRHPTIMAGVRASTVMPFYPDSVYEPGDPLTNPNGPQFRLGPALGYVFYDQPQKRPRFNKPTLLLMPQWNILHRWRTGRDVSAAMPTIVIAFAFSGQLWGKN